MAVDDVEQVANSVLYEGYLLYPYRPSALKNRHRWTFGVVYPPSFAEVQRSTERSCIQTECLVEGHLQTQIELRVRFLRVAVRTLGEEIDSRGHGQTGQDAVESEIADRFALHELHHKPRRRPFAFATERSVERVHNGIVASERQSIKGEIEASIIQCNERLFRLAVQIENHSEIDTASPESRDQAILRSLVSTHAILTATDGAFVSLLDPPDCWRESADGCRNEGLWPVLAGDPNARNMILASPIILDDYPRVAAESPGVSFDSTEIDELLSLRIQTLTDEEKQEARLGDERARQLFDRADRLAHDEMRRLHGKLRLNPASVQVGDVELQPGSRVRLRPRRRADVFDFVLDGKTATIQSIEQSYEDQVFVAVTIDEDPGRDLGKLGKPGHRFFFHADEIEALDAGP